MLLHTIPSSSCCFNMVNKMLPLLHLSIFLLSVLSFPCFSLQSKFSSIYEVLKSHGLPMGLLPMGVSNFTFDDSGKFEVHLDQPCNAKFENELHYEINVSGNLRYGQIGGLSGISAQDLFLWFPVKEIRVDIPSTGRIYFDVGVVFKQFSLSSFETPRECTAVQLMDQVEDGKHVLEALSKNLLSDRRFQLDQGKVAWAIL